MVPGSKAGWDVWIYSFEKKEAKPFLQSIDQETGPVFSPDGRWLAYASNESGRHETTCRRSPVRLQTGPPRLPRPPAARDGWSRRPGCRWASMAVPITVCNGTLEAEGRDPGQAARQNPTPGTETT